MPTADQIIAALGLQPLTFEGGFFRETYRSPESVRGRSMCTAIYYFLTPQTCSAMHRLPADEVFHFYLGDPVDMLLLLPDGGSQTFTLGADVLAGQSPQVLVPRGVWQGSRLADGGRFALLGTTMAPGFDTADYEAGHRAALTARYPDRADAIRLLTPFG